MSTSFFELSVFKNKITQLWNKFTDVDPRSYAALRIGLGVCGLLDIFISRIPSVPQFLSDEGVIPRKLISENASVSLFFASGDPLWAYFLLLIMAIVSIGLIVGLHSRICIIVYYFLFLSLHWRTEFTLGGPDRLHLLISMWALFLPLGCYASVDAFHKFKTCFPQKIVFSFNDRLATFGIILLYATMFLMASWYKIVSEEWYTDFTALYYVLNTGYHVTPIGFLFKDYVYFTKFLTASTLIVEWMIGILLLMPFYVRFCRTIAAFILFSLKLGFGCFLFVSLFPVIGMVFSFFILPTSIWNRISIFYGFNSKFEKLLVFLAKKTEFIPLPRILNGKILRIPLTGILVFNVYTHAASNWDDLSGWELSNSQIDIGIKKYIRFFRIDQTWVMFKNAPRWNAWPEVVLTLGDGTLRDVWRKEWQGTYDVSRERPERISSAFLNSLRMFLYHAKISQPQKTAGNYHLFYGFYECQKWNKANKTKAVKLDYYYNWGHWDDVGKYSIKDRKFIWTYECPNNLTVNEKLHYKY